VLLRALTWIAAVLVLLIPTLIWLGPRGSALVARAVLLTPEFDVADGSRLLLLAMVVPPYLVVAWGLVQLAGFCDRLARGEHFSRAAARAMKRFGWSLIASAALLPVCQLATRVYQKGALSGPDLVHGLLGSLPVLAMALGLVMGLIIIVFAAILRQATVLAEENARIREKV
jgi:hypothetical protein